MKKPALISHDIALQHLVPEGHPERPNRYQAIKDGLKNGFENWQRHQAVKATIEQLQLVHTKEYLDQLFQDMENISSFTAIDADTIACKDTLETALFSAGAACLGIDLVMDKKADVAFSSMRPPGHHAEPDKAMGFCFFSNAAIAACHAQRVWGINRVAVLDFDVHHGNGTQACLWDKKDLYYASSHEMPLFPGSGDPAQTGKHENIFNIALKARTTGTDFLKAWQEILLPKIANIKPELVIISAGFDAHTDDPLANICLEIKDFATLTRAIVELANKYAQGRIVSLLEGGYDLNALTHSVKSHLQELSK